MPKHAQKRAPEAFLMHSWEILCEPLLLKGQFHGYTHPSRGQFHGICLKESQPLKRTYTGRAAPLKRTFDRANAPDERTFCMILLDLTKHLTPHAKMHTLRLTHAPRCRRSTVCRWGSRPSRRDQTSTLDHATTTISSCASWAMRCSIACTASQTLATAGQR